VVQICRAGVTVVMRVALVVARVVAAAVVTEAEAVLVVNRQGLLVGSSAAAARAAAATPLVVAATAAMAVIMAGLVVVEAKEAEVGDCFPCHRRSRENGGKRCRSACRLFASWIRPRRNSLAHGTNHTARSSWQTHARGKGTPAAKARPRQRHARGPASRAS
jgi:hypothetical protein